MLTIYKNNNLMQQLVTIGILLFPIFFIAIPKITTALATLLFLICIIDLFATKFHINFDEDVKIIVAAFFSYPLAIVISQILRWQFELIDFQQQGRILLLLPLFFYIYNYKFNLSKLVVYIVPMTCFAGAISSLFLFNGASQWGPRNTVAHIDPLNFGYLMLFLAFASLSIGLQWAFTAWHKALCFCAFACGIYMSIRSGSRTGWVAIPIVVFWFLWSTHRLKIKTIMIASFSLVLAGVVFYYFSEIAHHRVDETIKDFKNYSWLGNPAANDSSVGVRLSMIRMAWHCFAEAPWSGYGVRNIYDVLNHDAIQLFATESVIQFSSSGFMHNEFLTQLVKHGVFGGAAYLFILSSIFYIYKKLKTHNIKSSLADVFIIYIIFAMIASLSTEILVVKPMILFFGFMLACYAGESLWRIHDKEHAVSA